ncbi:MAG: Inositol monophosphatase family protein [Nitrospira sp.]|nr:3'(2'),5'-bisphosphate nucleotidase CysQ [Nitrospira sp.]ULA60790.1 MAG: Inositol monophosphatase family protein [Nitrospira sp.]
MDHELTILSEVMSEAGREALRLAAAGFETFTKPDQSPVTSADLAVNRILHDRLSTAFPEDGWLSEETADNDERLRRTRVWIVDPIDGTRAFVKGLPEFCLSVALVENGVPTVAAIFNPATGEFFSAIRGRGLRVERLLDSAQPLFTSPERPVALVNPWELRVGRLEGLQDHLHCRPIGSIAYALALVAAGQADAVITLAGGNEWDVAAGVLLVEESGGRATTAAGHPVTFNRPDPRLPGTLAMGSDLPAPARTRLIEHSLAAASNPL